jgi:hypothetical protein
MGITDKAKEKLEKDDREEGKSSGGEHKQGNAKEPDSAGGGREADEAPNPTKAAEDVD